MRRWWIVLCLGFTLAVPCVTRAEESPKRCPICRAANNPNTPYTQKAGVTLMRGVTNTAFGWTELLVQPSAEVERGGNLLVGIGKGMGYAVTRTAGGVGELFTFWLPKGAQGYPKLSQDCPICMSATEANRNPSTEPPKTPQP